LDDKQRIQTVVEKPKNYASNLAITGLYLFDQAAPCYAKMLKPSDRGETEITDLIKIYLRENRVSYSTLGRGYTWYDAGTPASILQVSNFVETIETRQGLLICSPEEIAYWNGWISKATLIERGKLMEKNQYGQHLLNVAAGRVKAWSK
jgi:glucose-1-phosphate thymidylyltransferase